jgi:predicted transcriptional regulator
MSAHPILADLRRIRKESGLSQETMAAAIRMSSGQTFISRLENGRHDPLLVTVSNWADALGYELVLRRREP